VQDRFAIGLWVRSAGGSKDDERYQEIAQANFHHGHWGLRRNTAEKAKRQLELCRNTISKRWSQLRDRAAETPDGPACWGYHVFDEPYRPQFPNWAARRRIRQARPGNSPYINLFPTYALAAIGTNITRTTFNSSSRKSNRRAQHGSLSAVRATSDGREDYCRGLEVFRVARFRPGGRFGISLTRCPLVHTPIPPKRNCLEIYTSLAYGGAWRHVFCYSTPNGAEFPKGGPLSTLSAGRPATTIRPGELMRNPQSGTDADATDEHRHYSPDPHDPPARALKGTPIKNITRAATDPLNDYLIGNFRHKDGRRAVLINNYRFAYTAWPTVQFDVDPPWSRRWTRHRQGKAGRDDSPDMRPADFARCCEDGCSRAGGQRVQAKN